MSCGFEKLFWEDRHRRVSHLAEETFLKSCQPSTWLAAGSHWAEHIQLRSSQKKCDRQVSPKAGLYLELSSSLRIMHIWTFPQIWQREQIRGIIRCLLFMYSNLLMNVVAQAYQHLIDSSSPKEGRAYTWDSHLEDIVRATLLPVTSPLQDAAKAGSFKYIVKRGLLSNNIIYSRSQDTMQLGSWPVLV